MKHVSPSVNDSTTPTTLVESPDITTTYMENAMKMSNSDNIKPINKKIKVQDISLHI
jgi:hypothetical protein